MITKSDITLRTLSERECHYFRTFSRLARVRKKYHELVTGIKEGE